MLVLGSPTAIMHLHRRGRKLEVKMHGLEGMKLSHVTVMAMVTNTCVLHLVDINKLYHVLGHLLPGIDVVTNLHLVDGTVLYTASIVEIAMVIVGIVLTGEVEAEGKAKAAAVGIASEVRTVVVVA